MYIAFTLPYLCVCEDLASARGSNVGHRWRLTACCIPLPRGGSSCPCVPCHSTHLPQLYNCCHPCSPPLSPGQACRQHRTISTTVNGSPHPWCLASPDLKDRIELLQLWNLLLQRIQFCMYWVPPCARLSVRCFCLSHLTDCSVGVIIPLYRWTNGRREELIGLLKNHLANGGMWFKWRLAWP